MSSLKLTLVILAGVVLGVVLLVMVSVSPTLANAETYTYQDKYPLYVSGYSPCANNGAGEEVELSGDLNYLYHFTIDDSGSYHAKWHSNYQGMAGIGLTTGDKYQAIAADNYEWNGQVGYESTDTHNFRLIGPGQNNVLFMYYKLHITVNADGTVTAYHDSYSYECK